MASCGSTDLVLVAGVAEQNATSCMPEHKFSCQPASMHAVAVVAHLYVASTVECPKSLLTRRSRLFCPTPL
jgi:hypothetical protein